MELEQRVENRIVVDTDVFSYIFRGDSRADFFRRELMHKTLAVSFMTVAELYYGAYKDGWGANRITRLENTIKNYVVLPYDYFVCQEWALIKTELEQKGESISLADLWIAACARHNGCAVATNNGQHFSRISNLTVICPTLFAH